MIRACLCLTISLILTLASSGVAMAQLSWDGGNGTFVWSDFGNWNPDGNPLNQAISIGNLPAATNDTTLVNSSIGVNSLTITNGADVVNSTDAGATTEFELVVNGPTTISNAGSSIVVYGGVPDGLDTDTLTINTGADLILNSQQVVGTAVVEVDSGALTNNTGGLISGNGRIDLEQSVGGVTILLNNEGTLTATSIGPALFAPATTLQITAIDVEARVDLDGAAANAGIVNINRNATLDVDVPISDSFSGDMNLADGATLDIASGWIIGDSTVDINTPGILVGTGGPAAHFVGGAISMIAGTLTLNDGLDSLVVDAPFTGTGGAIANSGLITFNAATTIGAAVNFDMNGPDAKLTVNATVNIDTPDFNLDSTGLAGNITTINAGGNLDLDLGAGADEDFDHTINLNGGELDVTTVDNNWGLTSLGTINAGGAATSIINGETFNLSGQVHVAAGAALNINTVTVITNTTNIDIAANATLNFNDTVEYFNAGATITGAGTLLKGNAQIDAATIWNVGTVDLDDGVTAMNASLTINTNAIDSIGDGLDATIVVGDSAVLTVNINGGGSWAVDPAGVITYNGNVNPNTYLVGSDIAMNGTFNNNGDGGVDARLDIGATGIINILDAGEPLSLYGGDIDHPNTIAGGTINGPGILSGISNRALEGFGTINATADFNGSANLLADNGTLTLTSGIIDANLFGTDDDDGILNVTTPWNTNVTQFVVLRGGELKGATITNDGPGGIVGDGLLSARVINNTKIVGGGGTQTLIVQAAGNDNDWDGTTNTGELNSNGVLELRDDAAFPFMGKVGVQSAGTVFANGFELEFEPGSMLGLTAGEFHSTNATHIGGTVTVNAGAASRLKIEGTATFENGSSTLLNGDLELDNDTTIVQVGADFSGGGALVNLFGSTLRLNDGVNSSDFAVLIENQGELQLSTTGTAGQATAIDYQQDPTGSLLINIGGIGLNNFDRLTLTGAAQIAGSILPSLIDAFVPTLGQTFTIISAPGGVTGSFTSINQDNNLPDGLFFNVKYTGTQVQLVVVDALPGDYNRNGVVDAADYTLWRNTFGTPVAAFSGADGNGDGTVNQADYVTWKTFFGDTTAPGAGSGALADNHTVPEPSCLAILLGSFLGLFIARQRD